MAETALRNPDFSAKEALEAVARGYKRLREGAGAEELVRAALQGMEAAASHEKRVGWGQAPPLQQGAALRGGRCRGGPCARPPPARRGSGGDKPRPCNRNCALPSSARPPPARRGSGGDKPRPYNRELRCEEDAV